MAFLFLLQEACQAFVLFFFLSFRRAFSPASKVVVLIMGEARAELELEGRLEIRSFFFERARDVDF